ncbi:hypothetical protein TRAPUB_5664 [Trametes pubescens]|uniref:Uncharacterized protein n=1 Tax=Trametes pubescens TaxID=154538 RepID=A0A1M2V7Z6_TRAPU|nr:hypothetical protein TRAPUB_5664 [Trametes pubescens]
MHLAPLAILAATLASALPTTLAASCYSSGKCSMCETEDSIWSLHQFFCGSDDWAAAAPVSWGWARATLSGRFATQQECWDGFENIIEQCYSSKAGGTYDYDFDGDAAHLDVSFCTCE